IMRDNRVSLTFDSVQFPYDFVMIEGTAEIRELPPEELLPISIRIAERYVPWQRVEEFGKRNAVEGEVLVVVTPNKIISAKGVAD
ncbi:MAG: PPOX class F420-dependent oxidoreductase, partial [Pseudomonadota bacterium]